jgi:predicted nucleic acid-binding protein
MPLFPTPGSVRLAISCSTGSTGGKVEGFTSAHVVAEMAHRLMTLEASGLLVRPPASLVPWLKSHPNDVQRLARYRQAIDELAVIGMQILSVSGSHISLAADVSRQYGLLTNDALVVTLMRDRGLTHLASNDADFDRVPGITRYAPV